MPPWDGPAAGYNFFNPPAGPETGLSRRYALNYSLLDCAKQPPQELYASTKMYIASPRPVQQASRAQNLAVPRR